MRRFVLIFMLVLLTLRGWAGGVMAMDMLAQQLSATQSIAAPAVMEGASGLFDVEMKTECAGHAQAAPAAQPDPSHCGSCPLCQMCHSLAAPLAWTWPPLAWYSHSQPSTGHARFASAVAALALKPPIS